MANGNGSKFWESLSLRIIGALCTLIVIFLTAIIGYNFAQDEKRAVANAMCRDKIESKVENKVDREDFKATVDHLKAEVKESRAEQREAWTEIRGDIKEVKRLLMKKGTQ